MSDSTSTAGGEPDIRPIVRTAGAGRLSIWLFAGALLLGGVLLFNSLNARRQTMAAATDMPAASAQGTIAAPPPLNLPPETAAQQSPYPPALVIPNQLPTATVNPALPPQVLTRVIERPAPPVIAPAYSLPAQRPPEPPTPAIIDRPAVIERPALADRGQAGGIADNKNDRVMAGRLANPSLTVPQGTIIAAVLETALDSTRAGPARAIVSRDVKSFDGSHILIPRGSKLYGEYASDLAAGQKRALVIWHRLTRPDAVIIDLASPSADPLGRAGIGGKVDGHFFERFGGAILQSSLDLGVALASQSVTTNPTIVALPGSSVQQATRTQQTQVQPTLKVQQGTSVSVFVSRDLDFSTVDR